MSNTLAFDKLVGISNPRFTPSPALRSYGQLSPLPISSNVIYLQNGDGIDDSDSIYASAVDIKNPKHKKVLLELKILEYFRKQCCEIENCLQPFSMHLGGTQFFSEDVSHMPVMKDTKIERAFNDLMAANWDELPPPVVDSVTKALSKSTEDKTAHDALKNVFRAAEAIEEFTGIIMSLKMELTDVIGMSECETIDRRMFKGIADDFRKICCIFGFIWARKELSDEESGNGVGNEK
ncbi:membrane anchor in succinate dehydrogenase complex [Castilleja foliolosa]|uniref:Membrane anchor in succinate dehydrogenase complex n=1 Tax=Castilleja foliolosa TaxID=1961234 RepID=A0ABD3BGD7_9LAMI